MFSNKNMFLWHFNEFAKNDKNPPFSSFAFSIFHKVCAKTCSGSGLFVMSQRALEPLLGW